MAPQYEYRQAVRALLVDESEQEVLLIHTHVPDTDTLIWLAPGGGLHADESALQGLFREIREETGLQVSNALGPVWTRRMKFHLHGKGWDQSESFYYVPVDKFEPDNTLNPAADERDIFRGFRWWSAQQITDATEEIFVPLTFAKHFRRLLDEGLPASPYDVGR
jgi:8-oxo-dGTP pyrophosphatase MutT (NUDIX family)